MGWPARVVQSSHRTRSQDTCTTTRNSCNHGKQTVSTHSQKCDPTHLGSSFGPVADVNLLLFRAVVAF
eukprot:scaffold1328_cov108-Cylindrotheca_fusiformis.AAC.6